LTLGVLEHAKEQQDGQKVEKNFHGVIIRRLIAFKPLGCWA
jgi:hypothetical protein